MHMQLTQCTKQEGLALQKFGQELGLQNLRVLKDEGNGTYYVGKPDPDNDGLVKQFVNRKRAVNKDSTLKLASPKIAIKAGRNNDVYLAIRKLHGGDDVVRRHVLEEEIGESLTALSRAQIRGALSMLIHRYEAVEVVEY